MTLRPGVAARYPHTMKMIRNYSYLRIVYKAGKSPRVGLGRRNAVHYAYAQPDGVCIREIVLAATRQQA